MSPSAPTPRGEVIHGCHRGTDALTITQERRPGRPPPFPLGVNDGPLVPFGGDLHREGPRNVLDQVVAGLRPRRFFGRRSSRDTRHKHQDDSHHRREEPNRYDDPTERSSAPLLLILILKRHVAWESRSCRWYLFALSELRLTIRRALHRQRCWRRLVARRGTAHPDVAVVVVPLAGLAGLGPPAALAILHHQPLTLGIELLGAYASGIQLTFQFCIAAIRFPEIYLLLSKIHPSPCLFCPSVSLFRLCWLSQDGHVEGSPFGHRLAVLVEDCPPLPAGVVPNADRMLVVDTGATSWIPILRNVEDDIWVAVDHGVLEVGAVLGDVLRGGAMDEYSIEGRPVWRRFAFIDRHRALLVRCWLTLEVRHEHPDE